MTREARLHEQDEKVDNTVAQVLIELAFLVPRGTNINEHPIAQKLKDMLTAVRERERLVREASAPPAAEMRIVIDKYRVREDSSNNRLKALIRELDTLLARGESAPSLPPPQVKKE